TLRVDPGVYNVSAIQSGFVPSRDTVTVPALKTTTKDFPLVRTLPFTITGQVTDLLTGAPVVAMVRLTENSAIPGIITTKTDPSGRYSITMDPGSFDGNYTIEVTAVGYASKSSTFTIPTNGAMIPLNFVLAKQGILTGHVTQQGGAALGGAKVT